MFKRYSIIILVFLIFFSLLFPIILAKDFKENEIENLKNEIEKLKDHMKDLEYKINLIASNIGYITPIPSKPIIKEIEELNNKIIEIESKINEIKYGYTSKESFYYFVFYFLCFYLVLCYYIYKLEKRIKKLEEAFLKK
jgi:predicted PurR-regulated permease PerM